MPTHSPETLPAEPAIRALFEELRPRSYRQRAFSKMVAEHRQEWGLPSSYGSRKLQELLIQKKLLETAVINPENKETAYRQIKRLVWRGCTALEIASTLKEKAYLCHGTAVFLHGLTDLQPRTFYINREQTPKPAPKGKLTQAAISRAFGGKQRTSKYIFTYDGNRFVLLSGKSTNRHGVIHTQGPSGEPLALTDLERTLIDIVVRPAYAGGAVEILHAYQAARGKLNPLKLAKTLNALDYKYPYRQAIGFLLERSGHAESALKAFRKPGLDFDFYLSNAMVNPDYDKSWRLFIPQGF